MQKERQMENDFGGIEANNLTTCDDTRSDRDQPNLRLDARSQAGEIGMVTPDAFKRFGWKAYSIPINDPVAPAAQPYPIVDSRSLLWC